MPEFRQSPTNGEWVVIAEGRGSRPNDFKNTKGNVRKGLPERDKSCPFCPGGKADKEKPLYLVGTEEDWHLRVLENKFAALKNTVVPEYDKTGLFNRAEGYGHAEVVIESPYHNKCIATMSDDEVEHILRAYKIRYAAILNDPKINFINIFKNYGPRAGASLNHPHSQIIGSMVTPPHVSIQMYYARRQYDNDGQCIYCTMLAEELKQKVRIIYETEYFVVFCPYASKSPYEVRILPKQHSSVFSNITEEELNDLTFVLKNTLLRIYTLLGDPDYNFIIRSVTTNDSEVQYYHWYIVIIPKVTAKAGFEIGTGIYINSTSPETCAKLLKEVKT